MEYTNLREINQFDKFSEEIQSYNNCGYFQRSVLILKNAIHCFPGHPGLYYLLSLTYYNCKEYLKATDSLKSAIEYDDKNDTYLGLIGCCFFKVGDYESAFNYSKKALEIDSNNIDALVTLGKIEMLRHNYDEAHYYAKTAVEADKSNYKAVRLMSNYYIARENNPKEVLKVLYEAEKLGNDEELDLDIIKFLYLDGSYIECLKKCKNTIIKHSNSYTSQKVSKFVSMIYNKVLESKQELKGQLDSILQDKDKIISKSEIIDSIKREIKKEDEYTTEQQISFVLDGLEEIDKNIDKEPKRQKENIKQTTTKKEKEKRETKKEPKEQKEEINEPLKELNNLIGLSNVKAEVNKIVSLIKYEKNRNKILNLDNHTSMSYHFAFVGNPGTGKTTVARLIGGIFYNLGILEKGQLVEVDRSKIVGRFVGETAKLTKKAIDSAMGGILFIDEAYSLYKGADTNDFGTEAIETLIKAMEDNRDKFTVILAGYTEEMNKLINLNPGLKSRINLIINFENYSDKELLEIAKTMADKEHYKISKNGQKAFMEKISACKVDDNFANARSVRNVIEEAVREKAFRIGDKKVSKRQLTTLEPKDFGISLSFNREEKMKKLKDELYNLVGLDNVKNMVEGIVDTLQLSYKKRKLGIKCEDISLNMIFSGNPGTGKTTVARVLGKILKEIGVLKKGHLVEVTRSDLVGQYVGQTAPKTLEKIKEAYGGILFIDEAYSLNGSGDNDFGSEALAALIKEMEDNRDKLVVIMAGYTDEMKSLMDLNPGLQSRVKFELEFEDYNSKQLLEIFLLCCRQEGYMIEEAAKEKIKTYFEEACRKKDKNFGNGRFARKYFEQVKMNQAGRIIRDDINDKISIMNIKEEDIGDI